MRYCPLAVWCEVPFRLEDPCFLQEGVPKHASFGVFSVKLYRSFCLLTSSSCSEQLFREAESLDFHLVQKDVFTLTFRK